MSKKTNSNAILLAVHLNIERKVVSKTISRRKHPKANQIIECEVCLNKYVDKNSLKYHKAHIHKDQLNFYFTTNAILPAIWLKHVESLLKGSEPAKLVFFSARVGSISDNNLGGWYGYRASKSALNMIIKCAQIECKRRAKNICLISYHPGTVETELSKPFQSNVPAGKLFTTDFTVSQLLTIIPNLTPENGPHYIDWQGSVIPW